MRNLLFLFSFKQVCFNPFFCFNFQNHRRYVRSKDDSQLHGTLKNPVSTNCKPFNQRTFVGANNKSVTEQIAPCGAVANSMFNGKKPLINKPMEICLRFFTYVWYEKYIDKIT